MKKGDFVRTTNEFNQKFPIDRHAVGTIIDIDEKNRAIVKLMNGRDRMVHCCWLTVVEESSGTEYEFAEVVRRTKEQQQLGYTPTEPKKRHSRWGFI